MKVSVHFYQLNDDFSQEYADIHNEGKDSELNRKFEWEDQFTLTNEIDSIDIQNMGTYQLQGSKAGESFIFEIQNMRIFTFQGTDGLKTQMACSETIFSHFEQNNLHNKTIFHIYIKDYEPFANPIAGVYISSKDFPKELINE